MPLRYTAAVISDQSREHLGALKSAQSAQKTDVFSDEVEMGKSGRRVAGKAIASKLNSKHVLLHFAHCNDIHHATMLGTTYCG